MFTLLGVVSNGVLVLKYKGPPDFVCAARTFPMTTPLPVDVTNFNKLVGQYVALRDKIRDKDKKFKEEMKPFRDMLERLGGYMLAHLNLCGAESVGTDAGTVYKTTKKSASIADMEAFWTWVVTQGAFEFVDKKANVTAVEEYIKDLEEKSKTDPTVVVSAPPGVNFSQYEMVGVKRG